MDDTAKQINDYESAILSPLLGTTTTKSTTTKPSASSSSSTIMIIVVVVLVVAIGAYFMFGKKKSI